ncbi:MAG: hypothetical protein R2705_06050 [Ilumatobacteraceae bacterium]
MIGKDPDVDVDAPTAQVFGYPTAPSSSRTSWAIAATERTVSESQSGIGSRSIATRRDVRCRSV